MAIKITTFTPEQGGDMAAVKDWFTENAADFFEEITEEEGVISFKSGGRVVMTITKTVAASSAIKIAFYCKTGLTVERSTGSAPTAGVQIKKLVATSKGIGIAVATSSTNNQSGECGAFVTKTNTGALGIVMYGVLQPGSVSTQQQACIISENSAESDTLNLYTAKKAPLTVLCPLVCYGVEEYLPDCFFAPQSQYYTTECRFTYNDESYFYSGRVALRD